MFHEFCYATFLAQVLDKAMALDIENGRDHQANDSALAMACEVYATAHDVYGVPQDTAATLAAIASGVAEPWIGADGRLIS